ncbi:hypothetical protein, partial [Alienimonas chondri]|uniref:hypothetical protein n=1 Tax=Alienimonas chondri TaxID=2681879 RepID=UPI001489B970
MRTDATRIPPALTRLATVTQTAANRAWQAATEHAATGPAAAGALAGGALACVWMQWTLRFGGDPAVTFGGRAAVLCGLVGAWALGRRTTAPIAVAGPLFAAALAVTPLLATAAEWVSAARQP